MCIKSALKSANRALNICSDFLMLWCLSYSLNSSQIAPVEGAVSAPI